MLFTKSVEYAMKSLVYMYNRTSNEKQYFSVIEIAKEIVCSQTYLSKILKSLTIGGLMESHTGPGRGYKLVPNAENYKMIDILRLFNEENRLNHCFLSWQDCDATNPCPFHKNYEEFKFKLSTQINELNLKQLSARGWPKQSKP